MIKFHEGLLLAQSVLNFINMIDDKKTYYIEAYQNCREQGYMIINEDYNLDKVAYVTRDRHSDQLAVFIGGYANQGLSENAYQNGKSFDPRNVFDAAQYIIDSIN